LHSKKGGCLLSSCSGIGGGGPLLPPIIGACRLPWPPPAPPPLWFGAKVAWWRAVFGCWPPWPPPRRADVWLASYMVCLFLT
jgi:hypothetical protein